MYVDTNSIVHLDGAFGHNPSNRASTISLQQNFELSNAKTFPLLSTYIFFQRNKRAHFAYRPQDDSIQGGMPRFRDIHFFFFLTKTRDEGVDPRGRGVVTGEREVVLKD